MAIRSTRPTPEQAAASYRRELERNLRAYRAAAKAKGEFAHPQIARDIAETEAALAAITPTP